MKKNICDILPQDINNIICEYVPLCATPVCPNQAEIENYCRRCDAMTKVRTEFYKRCFECRYYSDPDTPYTIDTITFYKLDLPTSYIVRAKCYVANMLFCRKISLGHRHVVSPLFILTQTRVHWEEYNTSSAQQIYTILFLIIFGFCATIQQMLPIYTRLLGLSLYLFAIHKLLDIIP